MNLLRRKARINRAYFSYQSSERHAAFGFGLFVLSLFLALVFMLDGRESIFLAAGVGPVAFDETAFTLALLLVSLLIMAGPAVLALFGVLAPLCILAAFVFGLLH